MKLTRGSRYRGCNPRGLVVVNESKQRVGNNGGCWHGVVATVETEIPDLRHVAEDRAKRLSSFSSRGNKGIAIDKWIKHACDRNDRVMGSVSVTRNEIQFKLNSKIFLAFVSFAASGFLRLPRRLEPRSPFCL